MGFSPASGQRFKIGLLSETSSVVGLHRSVLEVQTRPLVDKTIPEVIQQLLVDFGLSRPGGSKARDVVLLEWV